MRISREYNDGMQTRKPAFDTSWHLAYTAESAVIYLNFLF